MLTRKATTIAAVLASALLVPVAPGHAAITLLDHATFGLARSYVTSTMAGTSSTSAPLSRTLTPRSWRCWPPARSSTGGG